MKCACSSVKYQIHENKPLHKQCIWENYTLKIGTKINMAFDGKYKNMSGRLCVEEAGWKCERKNIKYLHTHTQVVDKMKIHLEHDSMETIRRKYSLWKRETWISKFFFVFLSKNTLKHYYTIY